MKSFIVKTPSFMNKNDARFCAFAEEHSVECFHTIDTNDYVTLEDTFEIIVGQFKSGRFTFDGMTGFFTIERIDDLNYENLDEALTFFNALAEYINIAFISRRGVAVFSKERLLDEQGQSDLFDKVSMIAAANSMFETDRPRYQPTEDDFENEDKIILAFVEYACNKSNKKTVKKRVEEFKSNLAIVRSEREYLILKELPPENLSWAVEKCEAGNPDFFERNIGILSDIKKIVSW